MPRKGFFPMPGFAPEAPWNTIQSPRRPMTLPQHPARWILTILFLALIGLTLWIVWALDEIEDRKKGMKAKAVPAQQAQ